MKENKKKILTAAAFLIAAGLVFGMSQKNTGVLELDSSGTFVMSGTLDVDENNSADSGNPAKDRDSTLPDREENDRTPEESTSETRKHVENSERSGIYVYICGEVTNPGVYDLSENSRIYEAVDAAGGFTENAARECVNLASKVSDGMQITIYNKEEAASLPSGSGSAGGNSGLVNLNTATKEELMTLKGIGESKAEDIIRYREKSGGFKKIEDIMKISGIKEAGFQKIKDNITV